MDLHDTTPSKVCTRCSLIRPLVDFPKAKRSKDGHDSWCRPCRAGYMRDSRRNHPDLHKEYERRRKPRPVGYRAAYKQAWAKAHPDRIRMYQQRTREKNRERIRIRARIYYLRRSDFRKMRANAWHENNRARSLENSRRWKRLNRAQHAVQHQRRRARLRSAEGSYTVQEWTALKAYYDYRCLSCNLQEPDISLTVDHIVPLSKGGSNSIDNIQPLCGRCNSRKQAKAIDYRKS